MELEIFTNVNIENLFHQEKSSHQEQIHPNPWGEHTPPTTMWLRPWRRCGISCRHELLSVYSSRLLRPKNSIFSLLRLCPVLMEATLVHITVVEFHRQDISSGSHCHLTAKKVIGLSPRASQHHSCLHVVTRFGWLPRHSAKTCTNWQL